MTHKVSPLGNLNISAIEELYQQYRENPQTLDAGWTHFFSGFELGLEKSANPIIVGHSDIKIDKEFKILNLISAYRRRGHLFTRTNPVRSRRQYSPTLDIENFSLAQSDLDSIFEAGSEIGLGPSTLRQIAQHLQETYCESIGVEYTYMRDPVLVNWLQSKMESTRNRRVFSNEQRLHIFDHLKQAVGFEGFIHRKFVGQKRFSLEGSEALIPALDAIIEKGAEQGVAEFVIGMAHRGRLNVLANIMKKPFWNIFREFFGKEYEGDIQLGDVKYHLGYENTIETDSGKKCHLACFQTPRTSKP
jgi:2-oxoglutarate dehydrogenase E1 component